MGVGVYVGVGDVSEMLSIFSGGSPPCLMAYLISPEGGGQPPIVSVNMTAKEVI